MNNYYNKRKAIYCIVFAVAYITLAFAFYRKEKKARRINIIKDNLKREASNNEVTFTVKKRETHFGTNFTEPTFLFRVHDTDLENTFKEFLKDKCAEYEKTCSGAV